MLLYLVGCLHRNTSDALSHKLPGNFRLCVTWSISTSQTDCPILLHLHFYRVIWATAVKRQ